MRIFQILEANANTAIAVNQTWRRNLYEPLLDLGHEVVLFSAQDGRRALAHNDAALRARFSQQMVDTFRSEHARRPFDLVFAYLMDGMVDPAAIDELRRSGVPVTNFSCNNVHQFDLVDTPKKRHGPNFWPSAPIRSGGRWHPTPLISNRWQPHAAWLPVS